MPRVIRAREWAQAGRCVGAAVADGGGSWHTVRLDRTPRKHVPNTESAKKRVRQNAKRNALNNWRKRRVKDQIKAFDKAVHDRDAKAAEAELRKVAAVLDKVSSTSTMHRNTAARKKSRLTKRLKALQGAAK
jgi:small subunit ribosomal protein S20